jgi:NTE family protein
MSLPGVFAPISRDNRLLVDGGVLNNLPVEPMDTGEGPIIAVDVTARFRPALSENPGRVTSSPTWVFRNRRADHSLPSIKETLTRSIGIGSVGMVAESRQRADLLIAPETGSVGMTEFKELDHMVDAGRQAARTALESAQLETFRPSARP